MNNPIVHPVAQGFIPYRSPIKIAGGTAQPCKPEEANGESLDSSFNGDTTGYEVGQTIRARYLPEPIA
jgi:hypothetical protein